MNFVRSYKDDRLESLFNSIDLLYRRYISVHVCTRMLTLASAYRLERYGHRGSLRPYTAKLCRATRVGWFHLSQGIEVSIAAAMLHTRPLTTAPPCCIHFTSSPLSTAWTWILEAYSCPDGKRALTMSTILLTDFVFLLFDTTLSFLFLTMRERI